MFSNNLQQKTSAKFFCEKCDYHTSKKCNYDDHLLTAKHKQAMVVNFEIGNKDILDEISTKSSAKFICKNCSKTYMDNSGLWRHKKLCNKNNEEPEISSKNVTNDLIQKDNLIEYLIKENAEFKTLIMELVKKDNVSNNNSNNTINSHNKTFNLSLFLNETCKDALNIGEFVDSIKVQLSDLETFGHSGYVEGVSKILIKNLNELDTCKRPIHCSDSKREVLYIKDDDKWSKENEEKLVIKKAIKDVANKNIRQIPAWTNLNPDCKKSDSRKNDQYLKIVMNSMSGGSNEEQCNNIEKIIKNVTKSVIIDK
jgi:hypothetical protein